MSPLRIALTGSAAALAMSFGAAFAANTNAPQTVEKRVVIIDDGKGDHREMRWETGGEEHHGQHMAEHLRAVLQLTPAQEPALQAFLTSMKPPEPVHEHGDGAHHGERHMQMHFDHDASSAEMAKAHEDMEKHRTELAAMTTPQKLDLMVKRASEHMVEAQARLQQHVAAIKSFYAALTSSQQKAFDALHDGGMMGDHEGGGWDDGPHFEMHERMGMMAPPPPLPPLPPMAMRAPPAF